MFVPLITSAMEARKALKNAVSKAMARMRLATCTSRLFGAAQTAHDPIAVTCSST